MRYKLSDCIDEIIDNRGRNPERYYENNKYPVLDNYLIKNSLYPNLREVKRFIDEDTFDKFLRNHLTKDDVIMTLVGNGISNVSLAPSENVAIIQNTIGFRPVEKILLKRYLYYYFQYRKLDLINFNRGSSQPSIKKTDILDMEIEIPDISCQRKIESILSCIDEKIELNKKLNDNLVQLMNLFFSEYIINEIDDSWQESNLDEIADYLNGLAMQKFRPTAEEYIRVIKIREMRNGFSDNTEHARPDIPEQYIVNDGDILFSWSGTLDVIIWCNGKGGLNQHLFKVTSKMYPKWFYYLWTCYHLQQFKMIAASKATTMGHIKREELKKAKVYIPNNDVMDKLDRVMAPLINEYIKISIQNRRLTELRDTLLPRLMSGEIDIEEVEINE